MPDEDIQQDLFDESYEIEASELVKEQEKDTRRMK